MKRKLLALLLALAMITSLVPTVALAADEDNTASETSGGIIWSISNGTLTISPATTPEDGHTSGEMKDYTAGSAPWESQKTSITAITIEDGVTHIGNYAFRGLTAVLGAVSLPDSVKSLGEGAFRYCTMSSINLNQVETIGAHAIRECSNLTSLTIPSTVKEVGIGAFYSTGSSSGLTVLVDGATDTVFSGTDFTNSNLTSITFKNCSGIQLVNQTFSNCSSLTTVTYENCSGFTMGSSIFSGCTLYVGEEDGGTLEIPACVTALTGNPLPGGTITFAEGCTAGVIGDNAIYDATGTVLLIYTGTDSSFTVPEAVKEIAPGAFQNNTSIQSVTLPNGLNVIGASAFAGCSTLTTVNLPESLTEIGASAFSGTALTSAVVPANITKIPSGLFQNCSSLASVTFRADVTSIGSNAFNGCGALTEIDLQDSLETIGTNAFTASGLTSVKIPDCYVGNAAFSNCESLKQVEISAGATCNTASQSNISPFYNANGNSIEELIYHPNTWVSKWFTSLSKTTLKSVKFTGSVSIASNAFNGFSALTTAEFPNAVQIGDSAFYGTALTSVVIPESVTSVGKAAFAYCTSLESIDVGSNAVPSSASESMYTPFYASGGNIKTAVFRQNTVSDKWLNGVTLVSYADNQANKTSYSISSIVFTNGTPPTNNNFSSWSSLIVAVLNGGELNNYTLTAGTAPTPFKEGYEFGGWYSDSNFSGTAETTFATGRTYYAKWNSTITFDANGGTLSDGADNSITVEEGKAISTVSDGYTLPTPTKDGGTFVGWNTAADGSGNPVVESTVPTGSMTVYAIWGTKAGETGYSIYPIAEQTYTGEPLTPTVYVVDGQGNKTAWSQVTYEDNTTVGTATAKVTVSDTVYSMNFTINPKPVTKPTADSTSFTYNGSEQTYNVAASEDYTVSGNTRTDAGSQTVTVALRDTTNTKWADNSTDNMTFTFTIDKATPTIRISADKTSPVSGGGKVTLTVSGAPTTEGTVSVTCDSITVTDNQDGTFSATLPNETKDYTFTASYTVAENGNYNDAEDATCTVSVTRYTSSGGGSSGSTTYAISVDSAEKGVVTASPTRASRGTTITITVTPDDGYELDDLTVTDTSGNELTLTKKSDTTYTFTMPASKVTVEASFVESEDEVDEGLSFVDVAESAYYYDAVAWAVENNVTTGTTATTFSPDMGCTRAQVLTFLWRAAGAPSVSSSTANPFTDVSSIAYYYEAVLWAVENGITVGTSSTTFSPDVVCSRAQIVTFLWRYEGTPAASTAGSFVDVDGSAYYYDAVEWAVENGITLGTSATTFSPDADCTRAQIVTFLYRSAQ